MSYGSAAANRGEIINLRSRTLSLLSSSLFHLLWCTLPPFLVGVCLAYYFEEPPVVGIDV